MVNQKALKKTKRLKACKPYSEQEGWKRQWGRISGDNRARYPRIRKTKSRL